MTGPWASWHPAALHPTNMDRPCLILSLRRGLKLGDPGRSVQGECRQANKPPGPSVTWGGGDLSTGCSRHTVVSSILTSTRPVTEPSARNKASPARLCSQLLLPRPVPTPSLLSSHCTVVSPPKPGHFHPTCGKDCPPPPREPPCPLQCSRSLPHSRDPASSPGSHALTQG